jgi:hypothetical protein
LFPGYPKEEELYSQPFDAADLIAVRLRNLFRDLNKCIKSSPDYAECVATKFDTFKKKLAAEAAELDAENEHSGL